MFRRILFFLIILLIILSALAIGYLANINREAVTIDLGWKRYDISKIGLILLSWASGAMIVMLLMAIRETRRCLLNWKASRIHKRELRIQEMYSKGVNAFLARRDAEAKSYFDKILLEDPHHLDSMLRLGNILHREGDMAEAIHLHQKARDLNPTNIEALFAIEADYERLKRWDDTIQALQDILNLDETNLNALYKMRDIYQREGRWEDAIRTQIRLLKAIPSSEDRAQEHQRLIGMRYELGRVLLEDGNIDKAKSLFKGVLRGDKDFIPAYLGLGEAYLREAETAEASDLWEKAFNETSSIVLLLRLEDHFLSLGEPNKIIELYQDALSRNPNDPLLSFFLGKLYWRLEMIDDAYDILSSLDSGIEGFPDLHKLLGDIYLRRGSCEKAAQEFKKALGFMEAVVVPYRCSNCDYQSTEWSGKCPKCGMWNTYTITLQPPRA